MKRVAPVPLSVSKSSVGVAVAFEAENQGRPLRPQRYCVFECVPLQRSHSVFEIWRSD